MTARNPWFLPSVIALLGFILPVSMLSILYVTAPDFSISVGPLLPPELMPPGSMPDFPNGPVSAFFAAALAMFVVAAAFFGVAGIVWLGWWFRRAKLSSLLAVVVGPVLLWVLVFVIPMAHRVIRDYNAGFTRTDLLSYTAVLWAWVLGAIVAQVAVALWARSRWVELPT
jgi:hypothetical protein